MSHRFRRLSFRRVSVVRAGRRVLDEVTGWIPADRITVVSGPSGAGKTTLLRLCNRLEIPDHGSICYRGGLDLRGQAARNAART